MKLLEDIDKSIIKYEILTYFSWSLIYPEGKMNSKAWTTQLKDWSKGHIQNIASTKWGIYSFQASMDYLQKIN